jgi:transposase-like protein
MIVRPLSHSELREILDRQDQIQRHHPACPECSSDQVQIMFKAVPARWRCRRCKHWFTSEPGAGTLSRDNLTGEPR